jgi:conjugal transfer ATP-binding protein TraC
MLQKSQNDSSLAEELPYWDFFDFPKPHLILNDGSVVAGLSMQLIDIECLDDSQINQFTQGIRAALNSISEGVSVQFHLSVDSDFSELITKHVEGKKQHIHPLVKSIADFREAKLKASLEAETLYRPTLVVFIKTPMVNKPKLSFLKKPELFSESAMENYQETLEVLIENMDSLVSSFNSLGLKARPLYKDDLVQKIYSFMNPKRSISEPPPKFVEIKDVELEKKIVCEETWLSNQSKREQLVFGDLILGFEQFTLNSFYHRVITLKTMPEITFAGQFANFLRMPFHYDMFVTFEVPQQAYEMDKLNQKRKMAHSLAVTQGNKASDIESETKLNSTEELIRELLSSGQRIYAAQVSIVLKAPANQEGNKTLNRRVREVLSRFRMLQGAEGLEETVGAWKITKGNLPGAPISLDRARKMKTNNLADFLPVFGAREGDLDPVVIFRNRLNGLVSFDPFDPGLSNFNALVTGSSGAGKSFLNNCILSQELARDLKVFIIDIGGSYKKLTESLGGQYLDVNLSEESRLNPFAIPNLDSGPSDQKIKSLLAIVESMVVEEERPRLPKLEKVLLEKAINELYREKVSEGRAPILSDLKRKLETSSEPSMQQISKLLYMWTGETPYGKLLDGEGALSTNASICTFDLKGLSSYPDLQSVMILILTDFILSQVEGDRALKKRIILDEAWALLKSSAAAGFMEYCARTLRKTGSGITFITQGVEEIVSSPIGPAILNNTATKFIMLQRGDSQVLKDALKLNDQELHLIYSLEQKKGEFSEGFMIEGDHRQVVRINPSPFEYWLSTSDASDNHYLDNLKSSGLSLVEAIDKAARDYPNGHSKRHEEQRLSNEVV